ncbi:MAG: SAM-dependent methyltransferase [Clostridiaceae bacterium]|mgnify:CR=1 FL=1|nr:SAM-dependent methyltransferase [Clostridiaceae bacterium]
MNSITNNRIYSNRIAQIAALIEPGSFVIDIGTDHAHLPIALIQNNICQKVLAIDANKKPLLTAKTNIKRFNMQDNINLMLNNDLDGISLDGDETIVLAGLGGFLISKILEKHKSKFTSKHRFLLQPNWTWYDLRKYLADNGFAINQEIVLKDQGRYYSLLDVQFTQVEYKINDYEAYVGINQKYNQNETTRQIYLEYLARLERLASRKADNSQIYQKICKKIQLEIEGVSNDHTSKNI